MNFKSTLLVAVAPALMLAACDDTATETESEATETTEEAASEGTVETADATTNEEAPSEDAPAQPAAPNLSGKWACEDQGDVEVTITRQADGSASVEFDNKSEMAMGEPPIVTALHAKGSPAQMTDEQGFLVVDFLADGSAKVTDGEGADRSSYMCTKSV